MTLVLNVAERRSGKTTKVIESVLRESDSILLVPNETMKKFYPLEIRKRIYTYSQVMSDYLRGLDFNQITIDEGYVGSKAALAQLYYTLGKFFGNKKIVVYGTE
jgi:hypothetical protein